MPGNSNSAFNLDTAVRFFVDEQSIAKVNQSISQLKSYAKAALGAIGLGFSLRELNRMTEEYRSLKNSMTAIFGATEDMQEVQEKIKKTAQDVRGEYDKIAENVTTLVKNNRRVFDVDTANRFTDVMYKLTKLSGGDNNDASAAVQSLSSAMRNGKIDRGAIDQLINNVPQAIKVLTSYYGVSQERLRSMAQAGLIRSAQIRDAFLQAGEDVDEAFKNVQLNITDVIGSFRSQFRQFIGETDEMLGITKTLAKYLQQGLDLLMKGLEKARSGLLYLSDKLGGMENVLKLLIILAGAFFVAFHFKEIISGIKTISSLFSLTTLKVMALVAAIALVAILLDDLYHFMKGDKKTLLGEILDAKGFDTNEIRKQIFGTIEDIVGDLKTIWDEASYAVKQFGRIIQRIFKGIKRWWDSGGAEDVSESIKKFKNACLRAWQALKDWWDENGDELLQNFEEFGQTLGEAFGALLAVIADIFSLIVDLFTEDGENAEKDLDDLIHRLGELLEKLLDLVFGRGFTKNAFEWGHNFIEEFIKGLKQGWQEFGEKYFDFLPESVKEKLGFTGGVTVHASDSGIAHSGSGGSLDSNEVKTFEKEKGGATVHINDNGTGYSGSGGSFDSRTFTEKVADTWNKIQNSWWFKNSNIGGFYTAGKTLGLWGKDLEKAGTASEATVSRTTNNDSHDKNTELNYNQIMLNWDVFIKYLWDNKKLITKKKLLEG